VGGLREMRYTGHGATHVGGLREMRYTGHGATDTRGCIPFGATRVGGRLRGRHAGLSGAGAGAGGDFLPKIRAQMIPIS
jgi:hypothetical protein